MVVSFKNAKELSKVGNKAKFLVEMSNAKFNIPQGIIVDSDTYKEIIEDIEQFSALIRCNQDLREHLHWNNFAEMCTLSNRYLYNIVTQLQPYNLSQKELRLCILVLLKAPTNQMVDMIPYSHSGLGKFKNTTARKIGTTTTNFRLFLLNLLG